MPVLLHVFVVFQYICNLYNESSADDIYKFFGVFF